MTTLVRDLMSAPALTCAAGAPLVDAARTMRDGGTGSVVVVQDGKAVGILTERDLLRAVAAGADDRDRAELWMTARPDVLAPEEEAGAAWASLTHHRYRHLPVVDGDTLVGVVSVRDLLPLARLRPAHETGAEVPRGLEGAVVAETALGDVRGDEGLYHYRQYSATELAATRSFEDVWRLMVDGAVPDGAGQAAFADEVRALRRLPHGLAAALPSLAGAADALGVLHTACVLLGAELEWAPTHDIGARQLRDQAVRLGAVVPTVLTAAHRLAAGRRPVEPRPDLGHGANYLWMLHGEEPPAAHARAVEQYMILALDHGFNASTFTARVVTSTGADLAAAVAAAVAALSGPLHGGAPSRALDMLDAIGTPAGARPWLEAAVDRGDRVMGFGHRVYRTEDPRSRFLRDVAEGLGGPLARFARAVEATAVTVLAERKPGRELYANVEFYAGVVMDACGIPRSMFTPTFAAARTVGWTAHVLEQAADNRLIRPAARYVGPPAPQPVPPDPGR